MTVGQIVDGAGWNPALTVGHWQHCLPRSDRFPMIPVESQLHLDMDGDSALLGNSTLFRAKTSPKRGSGKRDAPFGRIVGIPDKGPGND
jgi:hypothetical protein